MSEHDASSTLTDLQAETERVGVDWAQVASTLLAARPDLAPADAEEPDLTALGPDAALLLPILRTLPDGAGTQAFLDALEQLGR